MNWLQCLVYGLLSGITEFLPVSADAHKTLCLLLMGEESGNALELSVRLGTFLAVAAACGASIGRLLRERRIALTPRRLRKRRPDVRSVLDYRLLRMAALPLLLSLLLLPLTRKLQNELWLLAIFLLLNGIVLYLPRLSASGNKDGFSLSAMDALLVGLGGAVSVLPGISRIGTATSTALLRGADKRYALDMSLLLSVPVFAVFVVMDMVGLISAGGQIDVSLIGCILGTVASFFSAWIGIFAMRYLAFKIGFSGFAYYSWGAALVMFILYLTV